MNMMCAVNVARTKQWIC